MMGTPALPACMTHLRGRDERFILFCDDLSFDTDETSYKSLKAVLDGGIEGRPDNVLFYATSNRRHLMPRDMIENERSTAINPSEAVEEKVSLSDRFGLWLGFHNGSQDQYLDMVRGYVTHFALEIDDEELRRDTLEWAATRGGRSGRVAWQYIQDLAGRLGHCHPGLRATSGRSSWPAHQSSASAPSRPSNRQNARYQSTRPSLKTRILIRAFHHDTRSRVPGHRCHLTKPPTTSCPPACDAKRTMSVSPERVPCPVSAAILTW